MIDPASLDWDKDGGLLPAVVQDTAGMVRMVGYMDRDALAATLDKGLVTFFSRSRGRAWTKGETSGHWLAVRSVGTDCDRDAILIVAEPAGPTCHTGADSCFEAGAPFFPTRLEQIVADRITSGAPGSYVSRLAGRGVKRMAQKVGEEGVEVAIAALAGDRDELIGEAADLAFHLTVLLRSLGVDWKAVGDELERRHRASSATVSS